MVNWFRPFLAAGIALALGACASTGSGPALPDGAVEGLQRVRSQQVDALYTAPGLSLAPYRRVLLDAVDVSFKRDWARQHREVHADDLQRMRREIAALFREVFARELQQRGGYALVDGPGPDVLQVQARIVDLDITAPDVPRPGMVRTWVVSAGEMTLVADLRDSQGGALLVRAIDRKRGRDYYPVLQIANAVTNSARAQVAFQGWARLLHDALDDARAGGTDR